MIASECVIGNLYKTPTGLVCLKMKDESSIKKTFFLYEGGIIVNVVPNYPFSDMDKDESNSIMSRVKEKLELIKS